MSSTWCKNMAGFKLGDEDMQNVKSPSAELYLHVTLKTIQAATLLGAVMIAPIFRAVKGPRTLDAIRASAIAGGLYGAAIGVPLGPLMTYGMMRKSQTEGYYDRSYRLRCNRNQVRVDRGWLFGAVVGMGYAAATGGPVGAGYVLGSTAGLLAISAYNTTTDNASK